MNQLIPITAVALACMSVFADLGDGAQRSISGSTDSTKIEASTAQLHTATPELGSQSNAVVASAIRTFERLSHFPYSKLPDGKIAKAQIRTSEVRKIFGVLGERGGFEDILRALEVDPTRELSAGYRLGLENIIDLYFNGFTNDTDRALAITPSPKTVAQTEAFNALMSVYYNDRLSTAPAGVVTGAARRLLSSDYLQRTDFLKSARNKPRPGTSSIVETLFGDLVDDGSGLTSAGRKLDEATINELATLYRTSVPREGRIGLPDIKSKPNDGPRLVLRALADGESPRGAYNNTYVVGDAGFATVVLLRELAELLDPSEVDAIVGRTASAELEDAFQFVIYPEEIWRANGAYSEKLAAAEKRLPREFIGRVQAYDEGLDLPELYTPESFQYAVNRAQRVREPSAAQSRLTRPEDVARVSAGLDEANQVLSMIRQLLPETAGMALDEALAALRRTRRELGPVDERPELPDDLAKAANEIDDLLGEN